VYQSLITFHSLWRWAVLISLLWSIINAFGGLRAKRVFGKRDNALRHWTATIAHIQLVLGILLYTQSPYVKSFSFRSSAGSAGNPDGLFFAVIHALLMLAAIAVITAGSALAKRKPANEEAFRVMALCYTVGLLLIIAAVPWPFSPLAQRPLIR
jgi:hypothetical protein